MLKLVQLGGILVEAELYTCLVQVSNLTELADYSR